MWGEELFIKQGALTTIEKRENFRFMILKVIISV